MPNDTSSRGGHFNIHSFPPNSRTHRAKTWTNASAITRIINPRNASCTLGLLHSRSARRPSLGAFTSPNLQGPAKLGKIPHSAVVSSVLDIVLRPLVIAAGLVALCIHANEDTADIVKLFMTGIAVRTIVREGASLRQPRYLGTAALRSEGRITLGDIFS